MTDVLTWLREHAGVSAHLCLDSRQVGEGDVFLACPGFRHSSAKYS